VNRLRQGLGLGLLVVALAIGGGLLGSISTSAARTGWNLAGTWVGQDAGVFVVKQSGTTVTWYGHSADNKTWAHDFKGTLKGDYVVGHFQDRPGFANRYQGDLALHIADNNHFEWVPSHDGVTSLAILTRSWTRTSAPVPTLVALCAPANCRTLDVRVGASLPPGQTTLQLDSGCGSRGASAADLARPGCVLDAVLSATVKLTTPLDAATTKTIQDALRTVEILPSLSGEEHDLIAGLIDDVARGTQPLGGAAAQTIKGILQQLQIAPADAAGAQQIDTQLTPLAPPEAPAAAVTAAVPTAAGAAPDAPAVIGSIQSQRPGAAEARAFVAAVQLARAATYSPGRAAARVELVLAQAFGGRELARELAGKPPARIATTKAAIHAGARRIISLKATPLGARLLRFLELRGLSHHDTTVRLRVTSTRSASKHTATTLLNVR
jgi:hypothetical protein